MLSQAEIRKHLQHLKNDCEHAGTAENEAWIKVLEWVLGDEAHQTAYKDWLASLRSVGGLNDMLEPGKPLDLGARFALAQALSRLE